MVGGHSKYELYCLFGYESAFMLSDNGGYFSRKRREHHKQANYRQFSKIGSLASYDTVETDIFVRTSRNIVKHDHLFTFLFQ